MFVNVHVLNEQLFVKLADGVGGGGGGGGPPPPMKSVYSSLLGVPLGTLVTTFALAFVVRADETLPIPSRATQTSTCRRFLWRTGWTRLALPKDFNKPALDNFVCFAALYAVKQTKLIRSRPQGGMSRYADPLTRRARTMRRFAALPFG